MTAKCNPQDEFDFEDGKKIALQRLFNTIPERSESAKSGSDKETLHLILSFDTSSNFGTVGAITWLEAYGKIDLFVGDVVETFNDTGQSLGLRCVCRDKSHPRGFIMGLCGLEFTNGLSDDGWLIVKRKSYKDMKHGDCIDEVEYV